MDTLYLVLTYLAGAFTMLVAVAIVGVLKFRRMMRGPKPKALR